MFNTWIYYNFENTHKCVLLQILVLNNVLEVSVGNNPDDRGGEGGSMFHAELLVTRGFTFYGDNE